MKATLKSLLIVVLISTFSCCTIQKRLFNKGYHIEWNRKFKESETRPDMKNIGHDLIPDEGKSPDKGNDVQETQSEADTLVREPGVSTPAPETGSDQFLKPEKVNQKTRTQFHKEKSKISNRFSELKRYGRSGGGAIIGIFLILCLLLIGALVYTGVSSAGNGIAAIALLYLGLVWLIGIVVVGLILFFLIKLILSAFRY